MDNKLSELSKPAAFIVRSPLGDVAYRTISQTDADYIARKGYVSEPLYSQEYVSALLAELEAKDERITWLESISTDYISKSQKAQECIAELEAQVKVWESAATKHLERAEEAEKRLATPVRLPGSFYPDGDIDLPLVVELDEAVEAIRTAGFTVEGGE